MSCLRSTKSETMLKAQMDTTVWEEETRFENPHIHYVDLSKKLYELKEELLNQKH